MFGQGALPSGVGMDKSLTGPVNEGLCVESSGLAYTLEDESAQAMGDKNDRSVDGLNGLSVLAEDGKWRALTSDIFRILHKSDTRVLAWL